MRKLVAGLYMSLNGIIEAPTQWHLEYLSEEVLAEIGEGVDAADAVLIGPRTYQLFSEIWPKQGDDVVMARFLNTVPKYVLSSTEIPLDWANSHRLTGPAEQAVRELKGQPGKDILIPGSPRLVRSMLELGLLDELHLDIMPIVVGSGRSLFEGMDDLRLEVTGSRTFGNGVVSVTYRRPD